MSKKLTKLELIKLIKTDLPILREARSLAEAEGWCDDHSELAPFILIINPISNKTKVH